MTWALPGDYAERALAHYGGSAQEVVDIEVELHRRADCEEPLTQILAAMEAEYRGAARFFGEAAGVAARLLAEEMESDR